MGTLIDTPLTLAALRFSYSGRMVLRDVSLVLRPGEMVALVGPSGCGKTTLAHIAAGTLAPDRGRVLRRYRRHGVVFQEPRLLPWATARDNIALPLTLDGVRPEEARHRAEEAAVRVALEPADLGKHPAELSGGMRQRVAIARALVVDPDFMIFDEPFGALDVVLRRRMQDIVIREVTERGLAGLFITHDLSEAARLAHRIAVMHPKGQGVLGSAVPPGRPGDRTERQLFDYVQSSLAGDPLFADLQSVDERAAPAVCGCDPIGVQRCC
ncbi:ATP-binding cassette domain-containing protein [Salipiger sp. P9]|uniref:ABC transporter ATP-binding protein n=1 Tax=Salipiger pentaromativorans TaxID=2943193 RepID=UPI002157BCB2|nr:ATP-binding cassette domain-containing protein [Salipiger pentaromativorans]MCR8546451.1 ATP-binding cassette domain-containing protein [Salipiger pentaromativorans]